MTVPSPSLSTILTQAERAEWSLVLGGLLQLWRAAPCVAVADLIGAIGERMPAPDPKDWEDIAAKHEPETLSGLLASLIAKGSVKARPRIDLLASGPIDPRIDRWVTARYADPPFTSTGAQPFYTRLAVLTARVLDASAAKTILSERETRYPVGPWRLLARGGAPGVEQAGHDAGSILRASIAVGLHDAIVCA